MRTKRPKRVFWCSGVHWNVCVYFVHIWRPHCVICAYFVVGAIDKRFLPETDGNEYKFLLKGHEDLRQDERVMQLFGLVNTLLANDRDTSYVDLSIEKYPVIPLSGNAGLIGWLDHAETFRPGGGPPEAPASTFSSMQIPLVWGLGKHNF